MIRCHITGRHQAGGIEPLVKAVSRSLMDGVDLIQIREKDMPARELAGLVTRVLALPNPHRSRILVNSRIDIAVACGAQGVHLPATSFPINRVRSIVPLDFLIGVSCHNERELVAAEEYGADFALLSPIFLSTSKPEQNTPLGLETLTRLASKVRIPVLALGGISPRTARQCELAGAAGVAGISMFQ